MKTKKFHKNSQDIFSLVEKFTKTFEILVLFLFPLEKKNCMKTKEHSEQLLEKVIEKSGDLYKIKIFFSLSFTHTHKKIHS